VLDWNERTIREIANNDKLDSNSDMPLRQHGCFDELNKNGRLPDIAPFASREERKLAFAEGLCWLLYK